MAKAPSKKRKPSLLARDFGKRLRTLREDRGLSQRDLAERIHTRAPQVSRYENGAFMPNAETLVSLAEVLRVDLDELLLGRTRGTLGDHPEVKDVRLLERVRELEKLDRQSRDTAIAMLEAIIVQGHQRAVAERLSPVSR